MVAHSKANAVRISHNIDLGLYSVTELLDIMQSQEKVLAQRASTALNYHFELHPSLIVQYLEGLLKANENAVHSSIHRNVMRLLQFIEIPSNYAYEVLDLAYGYLLSPQIPVAVRVFSLQVIYNISKSSEELLNELSESLTLIENPSNGMKSRMRRIRKKFEAVLSKSGK